MRDQLTKLVRHTAVYGLGRMVSKGISFLLIPFYTHYFATAEYGLMEILNLAAMIATIVLAPGLGNAAIRFYYDTDEQKERDCVISTALIFSLVVGAAAAALMVTRAAWISALLLGSPNYAMLVRLLAAGFFFNFSSDICLVFLRTKQQSGVYVFLTQTFLLLSLALNIYLVAARKMGVAGVFLSSAIAGGIFGVSLLWLTLREVGLKFSSRKLLAMLHFGAPLIFSWLAAFVLNFSDRFFLEHYSNLSQVGLYAVAYKFGYGLNLVLVQPFYLTWEPQAYEIAKREDAPQVFARIFSFYSVTLFTFAFLLSLGIREVFTIVVDPKFFIAYKLVPLIAFAYVAQGLQGFFESGLLITRHSRVIGLIGLACTGLCLVLNLVLIYFWTMWGACIATFISFCVIALASYRYSDRYYPLRCDKKPLVKTAVIGGLLLFAGWMLPMQSTGLRVAIKVVIAAAYFVTILKMGVFEDKDVQEIRKMAAGWVRKQLTVTVGWLQFVNPLSKRSE